MYTRRIYFGDISSQGGSPETTEAQDCRSPDKTADPQGSGASCVHSPGAAAAELCSPKSIYRLAEKVRPVPLQGYVVLNHSLAQVGFTELCDIAFEDIRSKLDENNILQELFSPFSAE